eukprot:6303896-Alexandrium_andersonii.AAC.1
MVSPPPAEASQCQSRRIADVPMPALTRWTVGGSSSHEQFAMPSSGHPADPAGVSGGSERSACRRSPPLLGIRGALQIGSIAPLEASLGRRLPPVGNAFELDLVLGQLDGPQPFP